VDLIYSTLGKSKKLVKLLGGKAYIETLHKKTNFNTKIHMKTQRDYEVD
jgi:hypothetical protein